ncbi:TFIIB-type zinc ribbon-containing protein [Angelakisella massiliensis]|uniref:TFIIB-type zinc ribbon-containing protein n=1 Tax=Angelakisella massiliensis TaxID=1871018 RepID=UPI000B111098|nr:TFIIB-type zinc ribbon-containing protein [Angelakisella massiliensis]
MMDTATTYKCPSCGAGLTFDPESQTFHCEYCGSSFTQEEARQAQDSAAAEVEKSPEEPAAEQAEAQDQGQQTEEMTVYHCPSCGAEIVTDATTAATQCFYCHNPVVLSGRLSGEFRPEYVIPFAIPKEEAEKRFLHWARSKRFVPRDFFHKSRIQKLSGVYFPYWMVDCKLDGAMEATANRVRVWRIGNTEYTETSRYRIVRGGKVNLNEMLKPALKKADQKLVESVLPFERKEMKDFTPLYLTGFQAEKRDVEREEAQPALEQQIKNYTEQLFRDTIPGDMVAVNVTHLETNNQDQKWQYLLLPVWTFTYRPKGEDKTYFYAMNGQTGKVCGELPIHYGRLAAFCGGIYGILALLLFFGRWLLG